MGILDALGNVSKGASDRAKSMSEANNLKRKILYEEAPGWSMENK